MTTLSLPLVAHDERLGALNLYSRRLGTFGDEPSEDTAALVEQTVILLVNADAYWDARSRAEGLETAMRSRSTIDQAVGIILAGGGRTPAEAFEVLVRASQRMNRKLRDVAADMVQAAKDRRPPPDR